MIQQRMAAFTLAVVKIKRKLGRALVQVRYTSASFASRACADNHCRQEYAS